MSLRLEIVEKQVVLALNILKAHETRVNGLEDDKIETHTRMRELEDRIDRLTRAINTLAERRDNETKSQKAEGSGGETGEVRCPEFARETGANRDSSGQVCEGTGQASE